MLLTQTLVITKTGEAIALTTTTGSYHLHDIRVQNWMQSNSWKIVFRFFADEFKLDVATINVGEMEPINGYLQFRKEYFSLYCTRATIEIHSDKPIPPINATITYGT